MNLSALPEATRKRLTEAYLGHRLNNHELVDLLRRAESEGDGAVEDTFTLYSDRATDWRGELAPGQHDQALDALGLKAWFSALDQSKVWSAEDRAVYRRLSRPDHDPATDPPAAPATALDADLRTVVETNFSAWDRDGNIWLDRQELDYLLDGGFYGEKLEIANEPVQAAALATTLRHYSLLGSGRQGAVSLSDLNSWTVRGDLVGTGAMAGVNETFKEYSERAARSESKPLDQERIDGQYLHQGVAGSCVLLSTILGTEASQLQQMITAGDQPGSYRVSFPDGTEETVLEPTLAARLFHSHGFDGERWPAILEIAAAQRLAEEGKSSSEGLRGLIEGIDPEFAIPLMTGRPASRNSLDEISAEATRDLLAQAMAAGGPVICGSRPTANGDFINAEELHNGIANGHCYRIQSYDRDTDTVTLQNPWHKGEWSFAQDGNDDGVFSMPLPDFYCSFRWVTHAQPAG